MKKLKSEFELCLSCMREHEIDFVEILETIEFKGIGVSFEAIYKYCSYTEELLETEEMIKINSLAMKDSYRKMVGLLTSREIIDIRGKYDVSQKDFSEILDWGMATITRYENHQVQDRAHDDVLRKIGKDPEWFLEMLKRSKDKISEKAYQKYFERANQEYKSMKNQYLIDSIKAQYAGFEGEDINGGVELNLKKVVEIVNYLAARVSSLHKVKLMKMLWYSDALNFKRRGKGISGLVYSALPMGAVPVAYEELVMLEGISYEVVTYGDYYGYKFKPTPGICYYELTQDDTEILDRVIEEVGHLKTEEIVNKMHDEDAYKCTGDNCTILYSLAKNLTIQ